MHVKRRTMLNFEELQAKHTNEDGVLDMEAYNAEVAKLTQEEVGRQRSEERKKQAEKHAQELENLKKQGEPAKTDTPVVQGGGQEVDVEALVAEKVAEKVGGLQTEIQEFKQSLEQEKQSAKNEQDKEAWINNAKQNGVDVDSISALLNGASIETLNALDITTLPKKQIKQAALPNHGRLQSTNTSKKMTLEEIAELGRRE